MNTEYEIRILEINREEFIKKIMSLGAKHIGDFDQKRYVYDVKPINPDKWIRLRTNGKNTTITIKELKKRSIDGTKELEITDVLNKYPYEMSGGQKQRVASARALVTNPSLILADEPTGALDSKSSRMLLEKFANLNDELKATILMVTHDAFTASYADRIIFIKDGQLFNEIIKGKKTRKEFFDNIIDVVTLLGGDLNNVI